MANREVIALNEATPQLEAAQAGDTYLLPRAQFNDGTIYIKDAAAAAADSAGYGQIWVDNATPDKLKFTNDAGTDFSVGVTLVNEANSIGFGVAAQDSWTSGTNNVSLGVNTLTANTTGSDNVAVGKDALDANVTGNQNVAIGTDAGGAQAGATDDDNVFIGFNAGLLANGSASGGNVAVGSQALDAAVTSIDATAIGFKALGASTANGNVAVGARALDANVAGLRNVGIGVDAGGAQAGANDNDNVFVGHNAGLLANGSASGGNTIVGSLAGDALVTSIDVTAMGKSALSASTASANTAVGARALAASVAGVRCVAVGADAGLTAAGANDNDNTFIGFEAGKVANGSASGENTAIGSQAAVGLTTGVNNTVIGNDAAASLTTGSNNIVIGSDADCVAATSNQVSIGTAASRVQILPGGLLRRSITAGITADVGSAQGGSPLVSDINQISTCANPGDSVTLPTAVAGYEITIVNNGAQACDVFPASGDNAGAGVDTAVSLAAGNNITYVAYDATNWFART